MKAPQLSVDINFLENIDVEPSYLGCSNGFFREMSLWSLNWD